MSSVTTGRGGARRGAGRKAKSLLELAERGTFSTTRHGRLLWTDDSLLEAAALRPDEDWLQRLAMINRLARERGHGRHDVTWFARVVREKIEEQDAKPAKPHKIEVVEEWVDGGRIITVRNPESDELVMTLRTASLCPDCVSTALRGVLERFEAEAKAAR